MKYIITDTDGDFIYQIYNDKPRFDFGKDRNKAIKLHLDCIRRNIKIWYKQQIEGPDNRFIIKKYE